MATDGDDANDGSSSEKSVLTWARAESLANFYNSSTIYIAPGTYMGITVSVTKSNLTIEGNGAVIDGETIRVPISITGDNVTLNNITAIRSVDTGITATGAEGVTLTNCVSHDNAHMGIYIAALSHDAVLIDCESYSNGSRGFYVNNALRASYTGCYSHNNSSYGYEAENHADYVVYTDCWANGNTKHGFVGKTSQYVSFIRCVSFGAHSISGFYFKGAENGTLQNCDSHGNERGVYVLNNLGGDGSINCTIKNNIFSGNARGIVVDADSTPGFVSDFNCIIDGATGTWAGLTRNPIAVWQADTGQDANSIVVNPDYVTVVYAGFVPQDVAVLTGADDGGPQGHTE